MAQNNAGRPENPNRRQRINVTLSPETLIKFHTAVPEKQRSEYIERLLRRELGLSEMEASTMAEFAAYKRSWNAGFVTEIIAIENDVVVDQIIETYNEAAQPEGIPDLVGEMFTSLRGKGFQRITSQQKIESLQERYQSRRVQ